MALRLEGTKILYDRVSPPLVMVSTLVVPTVPDVLLHAA